MQGKESSFMKDNSNYYKVVVLVLQSSSFSALFSDKSGSKREKDN